MAALDLRIAEPLEPYSTQQALLMPIPSAGGAAVPIAEIGVDTSVLLSPHHLAAWPGSPSKTNPHSRQPQAQTKAARRHRDATIKGAPGSIAWTLPRRR